ncbi:MAG: hypothetical protein WD739_09440 [Actinomycetota bacterium]
MPPTVHVTIPRYEVVDSTDRGEFFGDDRWDYVPGDREVELLLSALGPVPALRRLQLIFREDESGRPRVVRAVDY